MGHLKTADAIWNKQNNLAIAHSRVCYSVGFTNTSWKVLVICRSDECCWLFVKIGITQDKYMNWHMCSLYL